MMISKIHTQLTPDDIKVINENIQAHKPDAYVDVDENTLLSMAQDILAEATPTLPLVSPLKVLLDSLGSEGTPLLDVTAYAGYAFTGLSTAVLAWIFSSYTYCIVATGLCICFGVFLLKRVLFAEDPKRDSEVLEDKPHQGISEELAFTIHRIGCELSCNCSGGGDMKSITQGVFNTLVKYSWEHKVVMALSAFAVNYGEFCLLSQMDATNRLAKNVVRLKPLPDISERETLIRNLLKVVIDVTKTIMELNGLTSPYISRQQPPLSEALNQIPTAVYWAIKGIVACSSQSIGLMDMGPQHMVPITEAGKKLTDLTLTLTKVHAYLRDILDQCYEIFNKTQLDNAYYKLQGLIGSAHTDNIEILTELIHKEDNLPLFNGVTMGRERLDVLKNKTVILFISYLDISDADINEIVQKVEMPERQYEIVWLPIVEESVISNEKKVKEIDRKAQLMPWYSLHHSLTLQAHVLQYIKEDWHFEEEPVLVVLDAQGKVVRSNAYHMTLIWGSAAYPFDIRRERTLWNQSTWSLESFIEGVVTAKEIERLLKGEKLICLYGGEDLDWIREFTANTKEVVDRDGIILELIYVGKKHAETIINEKLSNCWDDPLKIRRFHARLDSILQSRMQLGLSIKNDTILKDVMMLHGANGSGQGWAIIGHGSKKVTVVTGNRMMESLVHIKNNVVTVATIKDFFTTLDGAIKVVTPKDVVHKHCNHIIISSTSGINQKSMVCVDCGRPMHKYTMYKCCVE